MIPVPPVSERWSLTQPIYPYILRLIINCVRKKVAVFQHWVAISSQMMTHVWDSPTKYNAVNSFIKQCCIAPRWHILLLSDCYFIYVNCLRLWMLLDTIDSRYIAVIYNTIIHTKQQLQWYNLGQTMHARTTPHILPSRARYGVSFEKLLTRYACDIWKAQCIYLHV